MAAAQMRRVRPPLSGVRLMAALRLFAAASDLLIQRGWGVFFSGWVLAPSYATWARRIAPHAAPTIIDSGAWTDHLSGIQRGPDALLERTIELSARAQGEGLPIEFCVLPDVVGDWPATALHLWAIERPQNGDRWALALQDGFIPAEVEALVAHLRPDVIFVGGSGMTFKRGAVRYARTLNLPVHVGRIHTLPDMCEMARAAGVVSVDTSTYSRPQRPDRIAALDRRLSAFAAYLDGRQTLIQGAF